MGKYSKLLMKGSSNKEKFTREKKKPLKGWHSWFLFGKRAIEIQNRSQLILLSQRSFSPESFFTKSCILGKVFHASDHLTTLQASKYTNTYRHLK